MVDVDQRASLSTKEFPMSSMFRRSLIVPFLVVVAALAVAYVIISAL
jgi:hypothetical protein